MLDRDHLNDAISVGSVLACVVVVFLSSLLGVLLPLLLTDCSLADDLNRSSRLRRMFRFGNAFAAGFLISAALVHLVPSATRMFVDEFPHVDYPIATVLTVVGTCAVLCLDIFVKHSPAEECADLREPPTGSTLTSTASECMETTSIFQSQSPASWANKNHSRSFSCGENPALPLLELRDDIDNSRENLPISDGDGSRGSSKSFVSCVLFVALCFHSFMEAIALGASKVAKTQFLALLLAIMAHKLFAAFALGVSLAYEASSSRSPRRSLRQAFWASLGFALTTPSGALIGVLLSSALLPRSARLLAATLSSISAGMFLYLAFVEMIADDFRCHCRHVCCSSRDFQSLSPCCVDCSNDIRLCSAIFVASAAGMSLLALWT